MLQWSEKSCNLSFPVWNRTHHTSASQVFLLKIQCMLVILMCVGHCTSFYSKICSHDRKWSVSELVNRAPALCYWTIRTMCSFNLHVEEFLRSDTERQIYFSDLAVFADYVTLCLCLLELLLSSLHVMTRLFHCQSKHFTHTVSSSMHTFFT